MPPFQKRPSPLGFGLYLGCVAATAGAALDYHLDLRPWTAIDHRIVPRCSPEDAFELKLRGKRRPPPIGCVDWPGGRVLLQWAIDEASLHEPPSSVPNEKEAGVVGAAAVVLEMGAGIGTASIGIAAAAAAAAGNADRRPRGGGRLHHVVATDVCEEALRNLEANAEANAVAASLRVARWDACKGEASVQELPVPLDSIRHLIGSDVVYHGFETPVASGEAARPGDFQAGARQPSRQAGLEATLAALLRRRPDLPVTLLLEDRFSGGGVSALAGAAGVAVRTATTDPAISRFRNACEEQGLRVEKLPVPPAVMQSVHDSQGWLTRLRWWLCGTWGGGLALYRVTLADHEDSPKPQRPSWQQHA